MALSFEQKEGIVTEVSQAATTAHSAVTAEYSGLSAIDMTQLHLQARNNGVYLRVVKNTLARRAIQGTDFECLNETLTGPLVLALSQEDPGAAARIFRDFANENDKLVVKAASVGGKLLQANEIERLANLPTKDQALSMLLSVMKAPISKLVRTLAEPHAKLVRTIAAVREQKQSAV